jgi:hypothetical protein
MHLLARTTTKVTGYLTNGKICLTQHAKFDMLVHKKYIIKGEVVLVHKNIFSLLVHSIAEWKKLFASTHLYLLLSFSRTPFSFISLCGERRRIEFIHFALPPPPPRDRNKRAASEKDGVFVACVCESALCMRSCRF